MTDHRRNYQREYQRARRAAQKAASPPARGPGRPALGNIQIRVTVTPEVAEWVADQGGLATVLDRAKLELPSGNPSGTGAQ